MLLPGIHHHLIPTQLLGVEHTLIVTMHPTKEPTHIHIVLLTKRHQVILIVLLITVHIPMEQVALALQGPIAAELGIYQSLHQKE